MRWDNFGDGDRMDDSNEGDTSGDNNNDDNDNDDEGCWEGVLEINAFLPFSCVCVLGGEGEGLEGEYCKPFLKVIPPHFSNSIVAHKVKGCTEQLFLKFSKGINWQC